MIIIYLGDKGRSAEDVCNGTITVGEAKRVLENYIDEEPIIIGLDNGFAEVDNFYDTY